MIALPLKSLQNRSRFSSSKRRRDLSSVLALATSYFSVIVWFQPREIGDRPQYRLKADSSRGASFPERQIDRTNRNQLEYPTELLTLSAIPQGSKRVFELTSLPNRKSVCPRSRKKMTDL
jgi:hypothetical protein